MSTASSVGAKKIKEEEKEENMNSRDKYINYMLEKALIYQQHFYELLPDWSVYEKKDIKHLQQNVGYAIFGPPLHQNHSESNDISNIVTDNITDDTQVSDLVHYGGEARTIINVIVNKICKYGCTSKDKTIKCGIIYVMVIDKIKPENKELIALPVFKILRYNDKNNESSEKSHCTQNIWNTSYIDIKGRVYINWEDYLMNNNLPECIIIYPKDGFYQPNLKYSVKPNFSIVWVVAENSKACCTNSKVISAVNTTMNAVGVGSSVGLGAAALFSPIAPAVIATGLVVTGLSGIWSIGKCSLELYDRKIHDESISPCNRSALSSWLGIVGSTVGLVTVGGGILLKNAAASGKVVGGVAKGAYNATVVGSISINLIGLTYEGYNIFQTFQEKGSIEIKDLAHFGTHLLFFVNNIINVRFANNIIEITQGKILHEYEANLRDDNFKKRYQFIQNATAGIQNKIEKNAAVIRYMQQFNMDNVSEILPISNCNQSSSDILQIQQGKIKFNGITLIDPILFVVDFMKSYLNETKEIPTNNSNSESRYINRKLMKIIENFLNDLFTSEDCPKTNNLPIIPDFKVIINQLTKFDYAESMLPFILNIALILVKKLNMESHLAEGCHFVWNYLKRNMYEAGLNIYSKYECGNYESDGIQKKYMWSILTAFFYAIDSMTNRFLDALYDYLRLWQKSI